MKFEIKIVNWHPLQFTSFNVEKGHYYLVSSIKQINIVFEGVF